MYQDNSGSATWATDISNFKRNKHIYIQVNSVRDLINIGNIKVVSVNTKDMIADCPTEPLYGAKLKAI